MSEPEVTIQNWQVVVNFTLYTAPELRTVSLKGEVYGHPHKPDGKTVRTSSIQSTSGRRVLTRNTAYRLGRISPGYRKWLKEEGIPYNPQNPIAGGRLAPGGHREVGSE